MGSIIDVAYNIVSKYKIGIKFDDLYEQIARKFDFDSDQYLENKSDLFNELCQDSRFQNLGKTWFTHDEGILRKHTTKIDEITIPKINSVEEYKSLYSEALKEEISHSYLARKKYRLEDGIRVDTKGEFHSYSFKLDENLNFPVDYSVILYKDASIKYGKVIMCDDNTFIFSTQTDYGNNIDVIEVAIDSSQLLQALLERIDEIRSGNKNLNNLMLNGSCNVNDKPMLKGQDTALKHALEYPITFVWGPPGTGKTKTLSDMVIAFLNQGKRVLMVSQSNVSVDGAMLRVIHHKDNSFGEGTIIRYGFPKDHDLRNSDKYNSYRYVLSRNSDLYEEFKELRNKMKSLDYKDPLMKDIAIRLNQIQNKFRKDEDNLIHSASFVATTISKATVSKSIYEQRFDLVLFDEASMAYVPQVVFAALLATSSFVCLGDYQQLPAIAVMKDSVLSYDIFRYVGIEEAVRKGRNHDWLCLLDVQRRMHPEIAKFVSNTMYYKFLTSSENMYDNTQFLTEVSPFEGSPFAFVDLSNSYSICTKTYDSSYINVLSAFVSVHLAMRMKNYDVGIITPYNAQARLIRSMIRGLELNNVECSTVHQFQGSEKSIIIFDAVDCYLRKFANDLLTSDRLINVAISRTKGKFIFVGNKDYLIEKVPKSKKVISNFFRYIADKNLFVREYPILNYIQNSDQTICSTQTTLYERFLNDLERTYDEVCMDINGGFGSIAIQREIENVLVTLYERGIKISVRFDMDTPIPDALKEFASNSYKVLNTITIIDGEMIWINMPFNNGAFKYTTTNRVITFKPAFNMKSKGCAKSLMNFLEIRHGHNKDYENTVSKLKRKCPVCGRALVQYNEKLICCSNRECDYCESIEEVKNTTNTSDEVLSVYVGDDIEIYEDYCLCNLKNNNNVKNPTYFTFRNKSGLMKKIYKVNLSVLANPKFINRMKSSCTKEQYERLLSFVEETGNDKNEMQRFYFLEPFKKVEKNNRVQGKDSLRIELDALV